MTSKIVAALMALPFIASAVAAQLESNPFGAAQGITFAGACWIGFKIHCNVVDRLTTEHAAERKLYLELIAANTNGDQKVIEGLLKQAEKKIKDS